MTRDEILRASSMPLASPEGSAISHQSRRTVALNPSEAATVRARSRPLIVWR